MLKSLKIFCYLNFFIYICKRKLINNFKKLIGMENKGYELQKQFYIEDSLLFNELIEANNKKGGNNGE